MRAKQVHDGSQPSSINLYRSLTALAAILVLPIMLAFGLTGCESKSQIEVLRDYPITAETTGVIDQAQVQFDPKISSDGNGALRITVDSPTTVRLFVTGDLDVEAARLLYRADLRTEGVEGKVYLEMLCHLPDRGEFFSRAVHAPLAGDQPWQTQETPFFLKQGENPDNVKLNLVINGKGTVWIDAIRLTRAPLK